MTLTREQIEGCRTLFRMLSNEFAVERPDLLNKLCDMALSSLPSGVMTKNVPVEPTVLPSAFAHHLVSVMSGVVALCEPRPRLSYEDDTEHNGGIALQELEKLRDELKAMLAAAPEAAPHQKAALMAPPDTVVVPRAKLDEIISALDRGLGDTDITHLESDEEIRQMAPVQWACTQLSVLSAAPHQNATQQAHPTDDASALSVTPTRPAGVAPHQNAGPKPAARCHCGLKDISEGFDEVRWYWQRHRRDVCLLELPNERCWCGRLRSEHSTGHDVDAPAGVAPNKLL